MGSTRFRTLPTVTQPADHGFPRVPCVAASLPGFLRKHGRGCATRREGRVSSEIEAAQPCPIREKHVGRRTRCNAVQRLFVQTPFARNNLRIRHADAFDAGGGRRHSRIALR